jgi:sterol desaturase/sphingolipid hydroxylase (fatty acid hydroxylase superfamily)
MGDAEWGKRDSRGEWQPETLPKPSPIFRTPWRPSEILKYLFAPEGLLWPVNAVYAGLAIVSWLWFTPSLEQAATFRVGWIAEIWARNAVLLILIAGGLHLWFYVIKGQGTKFKFSSKWLAKNDPKFLFKNQTWDNIFWNLVSGVSIWTAYEAVTLYMYAHHLIPYISFRAHPVYFILLMVAIIFLRHLHFYWVHRLIHFKFMYNISHYVHHRNVNVGPWSGLSMHPIEHVLYFSGVLLHWVIPSHPIHAIYHLMHAGLSPAFGHAGYDKLVTQEEKGMKADTYFHYLHHRFFTVNYGTEVMPLDKLFGSWHDGSPEAQAQMNARRAKRRAKRGGPTGDLAEASQAGN